MAEKEKETKEAKTQYGVLVGHKGSYTFGATRFLPGVVVPLARPVPEDYIRVFDNRSEAEKFAAETSKPPAPRKL